LHMIQPTVSLVLHSYGRRRGPRTGARRICDTWLFTTPADFVQGALFCAVRIPRITAFSHLPVDLIESFIQNEYATLK
jgi:hypothetical protein